VDGSAVHAVIRDIGYVVSVLGEVGRVDGRAGCAPRSTLQKRPRSLAAFWSDGL